MPTAVEIPTTMAEIDAAWINAALHEGGVLTTAQVVGESKVTIGAGVGILGELARVTLTYDQEEPGAPRSVVAKIPTADPNGKGIAQMLGFYEREIRFYRELAGSCPVRAAKCYYSAMEPEAVKYVLLLEDLDGLRIGDQVAGCTPEEARTVVRELGRLHARWWDAPEIAALEWLPPANDPRIKMAQMAYLAAFEPFNATFGAELFTEAERDIVSRLGPRMNAMQDEFSGAPVTMLHADPRLDNIFFGSPDGTAPVTFIDWQILVKGRGPYDIAYFVTQSLEPEDRRAHEDAILREYHALLVESGVQGYSWEQCWDDYRVATLFCLAYPVTSGGSIDLANERGVELVRRMAVRSMTAITDLGCEAFLDRFAPA